MLRDLEMEGKFCLVKSNNLCDADVIHKEVWDTWKLGHQRQITYSHNHCHNSLHIVWLLSMIWLAAGLDCTTIEVYPCIPNLSLQAC